MSRSKLLLPLMLACVSIAIVTTAVAKVHHKRVPPQPASNHALQSYHTPADPNAVYVGGTYAGSDPDPNIRAALMREFGKKR
jgi:hypothetical protein